MVKEKCYLRSDINIDEPRWSQDNYAGRARHFLSITNPLNIFASAKELERCKTIVEKYRSKQPLPECISEDELWRCKVLYDSAYHPDTKEKMLLIGRMSAQVPMNTLITGAMMSFYKSTPATIFWQWINQSFNSLVNYTNRSGAQPISDKVLLTSYVGATGGAVATALTLNHLAKKAPPVVARLVPFTAVAAANMINVPLMRAQELREGIVITDENDNELGSSQIVAKTAIATVVLSRNMMALPGMVFTPFVMNYLERRGVLKRMPWINMPVQCAMVALCLTFATPLCCALFKQKNEIGVSKLEPELQEKINKMENPPKVVYYNKGL